MESNWVLVQGIHRARQRLYSEAIGARDATNVALIVALYVFVLLLVPPWHTYAVTDDWLYARGVGYMLHSDFGLIHVSAYALSHMAWGGLFAAVFGLSYSTLTVSTLVLGMIGLLALYALMRELNVSPATSLFAVGMVGLNPMFVYLAYSFMSDVSFLTFTMLSALAFTHWAKTREDRWLWVWCVPCAAAVLTRQFGILLVVAGLFYISWVRAWSWRRVALLAVVPLASMVAYEVWMRLQPSYSTGYSVPTFSYNSLEAVLTRLDWISVATCAFGLYLLPVLRFPRRLLWYMPLLAIFLTYAFKRATVSGSPIARGGNVFSSAGMLMYNYQTDTVWSLSVWIILGVIGAAVLAVCFGRWIAQLSTWWRDSGWRCRQDDPALFLYTFSILSAGAIITITPLVLDRYFLPLLPAMLLPFLHRDSCASVRSATDSVAHSAPAASIAIGPVRWTLLGALGLISLLAQRDYMEHASLRWNVATQLHDSGVGYEYIDAGGEWVESHLQDRWDIYLSHHKPQDVHFRQGVDILWGFTVLDSVYIVTDLPQLYDGYTTVARYPYTSWLEGGKVHWVVLLKRDRPAGSASGP